MSVENIKKNFEEAAQVLNAFLADDNNFSNIEKASNAMLKSINAGGKIIACGNGGSMCDAMHFAEELTGRFRNDRKPIPALAISDASHLTCVANDYGFDAIFSRFVEAFGQNNDILFCISTSGNSKNIIKAVEEAKNKGMTVISLTGKDGGVLASLSNIEIRAPYSEYSDRTQEIHIKIIHSIIYHIEENI